MALRRGAAGGQTKQTGGNFYYGERHQLTVLVAFNDRDFKEDEDATLAQWNLIFNTRDLTEAPFKGSVRDYFYAQSYGNFDLTFDLVYVKVSGNAVKYASDSYDENSRFLVQDIMEVLKTRNINWSLYDWNGDGFVNQLLIVYAGQGMNDYDSSKYSYLIWPHQWWMSEHFQDGVEPPYCNPIPVTYNDKEYKVDCYCALAELTRNDDYGTFGTICHEYTHCFGFPDFYGTSGTPGKWDLMDSGNYNGNGYRPAGYSAHERWFMGWLTPIELKEATTITNMPSLAEEGKAYLIRNDGFENEYYIVENRQKTSWDTSIPGGGIIVFHIDYDPALWVSVTDYVNKSDRQHYLVFPANGYSYSPGGWAYPYGSNNALTNTSTPAATLWNENSDGTKLMSKPLTNMSITNGLASFSFMGGSSGVEHIQSSLNNSPYVVLYRHGPLSIIRLPNGEVRKVMMK